ncbi:hypothetical protein TIFTF001_031194 [Ficus carica]|uniref:Viral late gene transcription factor 3 zinc ribbon domain-containing protein n=1 Tax=Ficus carica TaxID=3494 RepID=A0AA88DVW3_FICCA|nr:hypothetical protein TIFTF001_031194 [Ficus carica]
MEASLSSSILTAPISNTTLLIRTKSSTLNLTGRVKHSRLIRSKNLQVRNVAGIEEVSAATDAAPAVGVTWQIVVGALAGATPFVVAGIEFSKRIIAQRTCDVCGGSGLVLKKENYVRCPGCGGFLPWQSWKRFFSG